MRVTKPKINNEMNNSLSKDDLARLFDSLENYQNKNLGHLNKGSGTDRNEKR